MTAVATPITHKRTITDSDRIRLKAMIQTFRLAGRPYESFAGELERLIASAHVVPAREVPGDVVTLNSIVRVRDLESNALDTVKLVDESAGGGLDGGVSIVTSLGMALLGARVGNVVDWELRWGRVRLRIEQLWYQPEAAGHFHL